MEPITPEGERPRPSAGGTERRRDEAPADSVPAGERYAGRAKPSVFSAP
jgi:hypothetical protein